MPWPRGRQTNTSSAGLSRLRDKGVSYTSLIQPFKTMYDVTQRDKRRGLAAGDDTRGPAGTPGWIVDEHFLGPDSIHLELYIGR